MGATKWITGVLGWIITGNPLGGLAGLGIGALFEKLFTTTDSEAATPHDDDRSNRGQRNSFLISVLVLSSAVIKADGRIMHSEMNTVRNFLRINFGETAVDQGIEILKELFKKNIDLAGVSREMAMHLDEGSRLQLLNYLVGIAQADGVVSPEEIRVLQTIARNMGISDRELDSLLNLGSDNLEAAYKVLELTPDATDDEVRKAYRSLALKHHPDKVAQLGADVQKAAEEKFKSINDAYETIKKSRTGKSA